MKLTTLINHYVSYRRSLGDKYHVNEQYLKRFCLIVGKNIDIAHASKKKINKFLYGHEKITGGWFIKYATLSGFYNYAISRGYINYSPLPTILPKRPALFIPYIYTRKELKCLFKSALIYRDPTKHGYIQPYMIRVLLILLYGMGLRVGEALSLSMIDVDMTKLTITIRDSKFHKCRIIPFGKQLAGVLFDYISWRKKQGCSGNSKSAFFINAKGLHLRAETVRGIFHRILEIANLKPKDKTKHQGSRIKI